LRSNPPDTTFRRGVAKGLLKPTWTCRCMGPHRSKVPEKTVCTADFVTLLSKFLRFRTCCITQGLRVRMGHKFTFQSKLELH
jgi:hypothetical protein